jgi:hypothetical protein
VLTQALLILLAWSNEPLQNAFIRFRRTSMISPEVLRRYPFFAGLSAKQLQEIAQISHMRTFEVGEQIFREGNTAAQMLFLILISPIIRNNI